MLVATESDAGDAEAVNVGCTDGYEVTIDVGSKEGTEAPIALLGLPVGGRG